MSATPVTFSIGDIVALKSNPFFTELNNIIMSGESDSVSPLMVVAEIMIDSQNKYNEKTGVSESEQGRQNCKCIWYSHKTWQFEESWLSEIFLKKITSYSTVANQESVLSPGTLVSLSTLKLERKKRKSFLKYDGNDPKDKQGRNTIHHVVSFMCPVMHVMDTRKNEKDEQSFDVKKGTPRKSFPSQFIKCKWFNHGTEKMSEKLLPVEALSVIKQPEENFLVGINEVITNEDFIRIPSATEPEKIIKPLSIIYNSGEYSLRGYDYVLNRISENELPFENYDALPESDVVLATAPQFGFIEDPLEIDTVINEIEEFIEDSQRDRNYIRIKYFGRSKSSWYTLTDYSLNDTTEEVRYLSGFCHATNERRTFRVDRIQTMQRLYLTE